MGSSPGGGHVALVTSGLRSITGANLELGRRLVEAGHRVTHVSWADAGSERDGGVAQRSIRRIRSQGWIYPDLLHPDRSDANGRSREARQDEAIAQLGLEEVRSTLGDLDADLYLIDTELHEYVAATLSFGGRVALTSTWLSIWKRPGIPPLDIGLAPTPGPMARARTEYQWLRKRHVKLRTARRNRRDHGGLDRASVLDRFASRHGVDLRNVRDPWQWLIPYSYRNLTTLNLNARELDFPHTPARMVRHVGPMIRPANLTRDPGLTAVLEARRTGERLVYCTFGSFRESYDLAVVERAIEALATVPDIRVLLGLGGGLDPGDLGTLPEAFHAFDWVDQPAVLAAADAAVTHAGIATINECVDAGVPMVVHSLGLRDQNGNAARVEYHGLGVRTDLRRTSPDHIGRQVAGLLDVRWPRERLAAMGAAFERYAAERVAERVIDGLLEGTDVER